MINRGLKEHGRPFECDLFTSLPAEVVSFELWPALAQKAGRPSKCPTGPATLFVSLDLGTAVAVLRKKLAAKSE